MSLDLVKEYSVEYSFTRSVETTTIADDSVLIANTPDLSQTSQLHCLE